MSSLSKSLTLNELTRPNFVLLTVRGIGIVERPREGRIQLLAQSSSNLQHAKMNQSLVILL